MEEGGFFFCAFSRSHAPAWECGSWRLCLLCVWTGEYSDAPEQRQSLLACVPRQSPGTRMKSMKDKSKKSVVYLFLHVLHALHGRLFFAVNWKPAMRGIFDNTHP